VNGQQVFCYTSFQLDNESSFSLTGRPVSPITFCSFDFEGTVEVRIQLLEGVSGRDFQNVIVRPLALNIRPSVFDNCVVFTISSPGQFSLESATSLKQPLHIFANPIEADVPSPDDPNVIYFHPGVHEVSAIRLEQANQTVYVAGGAVVYLKPCPQQEIVEERQSLGVATAMVKPLIYSGWTENITIRGRGILCGRKALEASQRASLITLDFVKNVRLEGIVLRESANWTATFTNGSNVQVDNIKILGHYENNDGIVVASSDTIVRNCMIHNADDALQVKSWEGNPVSNVLFENCVIWSDVGGSLGVPAECRADITGLTIRHCTVLHSTQSDSTRSPICINLIGKGCIRNVLFEDIVIEDCTGQDRAPIKLVNEHESGNEHNGTVSDVHLRNIRVLHSDAGFLQFGGGSEGKDAFEGLRLTNIDLHGRSVADGDERLQINGVQGVTLG